MTTEPDQGRMEAGVHLLPARVYVADTDAGGVVYHANYLDFMERGRSEFLRLLGLDHSALISPNGEHMVYAVVRLGIEFRSPARLDDVLMIGTRLTRIRSASFEIEHWIWRAEEEGKSGIGRGELLAEAELVVATLDSEGRLRRIPKMIHTRLIEAMPELSEKPKS